MHSEFPIPSIPLPAPLPPTIDPEVVASTPPQTASDAEPRGSDISLPDADENQPPIGSQSSTKENDAPTDIAAVKPPVPKFDETPSRQLTQPPPESIEAPAGTLPPDLLSSYQSSARLLQYDFEQSPPYTIQRLAELILYPRKHYRFLPAYLRALDRIVSVSSPVSEFPLPSGQISLNGGFLTNGDANLAKGLQEREGLGSDESLGGALLTPIPWLRNQNGTTSTQGDGELHSESTETIQGPNGAGSIETVSVTVNGVPSAMTASSHQTSPNTSTPASPTLSEQSDASTGSSTSTDAQLREQGGVTQGELLRQEQEAGVVPVAQTAPRRHLMNSGAIAVGREDTAPADDLEPMDERPEEHPHARGPDHIGAEDMGPQQKPLGAGNLDMEAAVGRSRSPQPPNHPEAVGAPQAEAAQKEAEADPAGKPAQGVGDAEIMEHKMEEADEEIKIAKSKDADGDTVVADADGVAAGEKKVEGEGGEASAADGTAQ